jgi:hypothetical protein
MCTTAPSAQFLRSWWTLTESISAQERLFLFGTTDRFPSKLGRLLRSPHFPWRFLMAGSGSAIGTVPSMNFRKIGLTKSRTLLRRRRGSPWRLWTAQLESIRNSDGSWSFEGLLPEFPHAIEAMGDDEQGDLFVTLSLSNTHVVDAPSRCEGSRSLRSWKLRLLSCNERRQTTAEGGERPDALTPGLRSLSFVGVR